MALSIAIPFELRNVDGLVTVAIEVNENPRRWGYHLLGEFPDEQPLGFPVARASVSYPAEGYAAVMGWIQLLRYGGGELGDEVAEVDHPPQHSDAVTPYLCWGTLPQFFDAPSMPYRGVTWVAEAFLATSPDALMTKTIQPLCGFRWGYDTTRQPPELLPLEQLGDDAWKSARAMFEKHYPSWEFLDGEAMREPL